jgi:hypothetical protein
MLVQKKHIKKSHLKKYNDSMKLKKQEFLESIIKGKGSELKRETRENSIDLDF